MLDAVVELLIRKIGFILLGGVVLTIIVVLFFMVVVSIIKDIKK